MNKPKCINPECDNLSHTRGLCPSCYAVAKKLVDSRETTWEKLEENGRTAPSRTRSRKRVTKTRAWLLS